VRRYHLRKGDTIVGGFRPAASNEKYPALLRVDTVAGIDPEVARLRPRFEDLTPLFPDEKLNLETNEGKPDPTPRIVDLLSPIGKGQRGLIVSPPKAGKTTVMKQIAQSIEANNPEVHLMVLLVDERPEEVTDMRRSREGRSHRLDLRPSGRGAHPGGRAGIERAKRLVEQGRDVVIILDGITRLARAYNLAAGHRAHHVRWRRLRRPLPAQEVLRRGPQHRRGRLADHPGHALVETGSKMDEVIFEEFKGTGNMELRSTASGRAPPLPGHRRQRQLDPPRGAALRPRASCQQVWKLRRV
jgi:transcription termination factor Rho